MALEMKFTYKGFNAEFYIATDGDVDVQKQVGAMCAALNVAVEECKRLGIVPDVIATPPAASAGGPTNGTATTNGGSSEQWNSSALVHDFQNGKHQFRIKGGRWQAFGVAVYEDIGAVEPNLKQQLFAAPLGETPFVHLVTCQLGADGKPKKITAIA